MSRLLIIRFSALGDVAMTVPVIYSLAKQYPDTEITVLSRENFRGIFQNPPENVHFQGINLDNYKGLKGLNKLYKNLRVDSFDYVADFHNVLRTKYIRFRFKLSGIQVAAIDKEKKEKKKLTRKHRKILKQLDTSFIRYKKVLEQLGFNFELKFKSLYPNEWNGITEIEQVTGKKGENKWIGIAPFAKHKGKIYPLELQEQVIAHFSRKQNMKVFLFGGGKKEKQIVEDWIEKYPTLISVIGKLNMEQELHLLNNMDLTLSMDSANMHLASLVNTPVLSVWGATHPYAGFMGWNQPYENAIQTDLYCRPCSVFGQKPCYRGDYACLYQIKPEIIIGKIENFLQQNQATKATVKPVNS